MHKGVILLVNAESRKSAEKRVVDFLEGYGNGDVWDWYVIGGRWSGTLNPMYKQFADFVDKNFPKELDMGFSQQFIDSKAKDLQNIWEHMGGKGKNPYSRSTYDQDGCKDDIMPLKECIKVVRELAQDPVKAGKNELKQADYWLKKNKNLDYHMYGYCLEKAGKLFKQDCRHSQLK
jgi:hypothetical protein